MFPALRFYAFWSINRSLDPSRLRQQLLQFRQAGFDGVVFHPRFYPGMPPYLSQPYLDIVSDVILAAKSLGLLFWIYDENGWPSGTVGGEMLRLHPEHAQQWAELAEERPADCLAEFTHAGKTWYLARRIGAGVDYLSPGTARDFIKLTHERYRAGLSAEAFDHVEVFFCDEPEFGLGHAFDALPQQGAIPWTPRIQQLFQKRHGEDLAPLLPLLFFPGTRSGEVRVKFWELLTDTFCESFVAPLDAWCWRHGKRFTAHVKGEEHPLFQVPLVGSCHQFFQHLSLPAIDALERNPSNDFYPRQMASVAAQFGDGRCMAESFGGAGWGARPEDLEKYLLWLGRNGVTDLVMHLSQYRLDSAAIRDWPPSQPLHLNWRDVYPEVLRRVRENLSSSATGAANTLVVTPHRGIMAAYEPRELTGTNIHNAATYPDSPAARINGRFLDLVKSLNARGLPHHFADERTFESGAIRGAQLRIGQCTYAQIILADGCLLSMHGQRLVEKISAVPWPLSSAEIARTAADTATVQSVNVSWKLTSAPKNSLLLEPSENETGTWSASFFAETDLEELSLVFADDITDLRVNDVSVQVQSSPDGCTAALRTSKGNVRFRTTATNPFVWLEGHFLVTSTSPFAPGRNDTVRTDGPFKLLPPANIFSVEHVASGFPFCRRPLLLEADLTTDRAQGISFTGMTADAAQVWFNGEDCGFVYGPDWTIGRTIPPGTHRLRLALIPSTYNFYGPHHHVDGDRHVVSPDQFSGRKNFADHPESPKHTLLSAWHFKPIAAPGVNLLL